eukprot:7450941-Pyramimonas_sp.AAC.1
MTGFVTCVNDVGESFLLTVVPPAMVKEMLHAASLRSLERDAAVKAKGECPRLCFDIVRNRLRSSKIPNLGAKVPFGLLHAKQLGPMTAQKKQAI